VRFGIVRVKIIGAIRCSGCDPMQRTGYMLTSQGILQSPSPGMMMETAVPLKHMQQCS
jgi:hypothetical protein